MKFAPVFLALIAFATAAAVSAGTPANEAYPTPAPGSKAAQRPAHISPSQWFYNGFSSEVEREFIKNCPKAKKSTPQFIEATANAMELEMKGALADLFELSVRVPVSQFDSNFDIAVKRVADAGIRTCKALTHSYM